MILNKPKVFLNNLVSSIFRLIKWKKVKFFIFVNPFFGYEEYFKLSNNDVIFAGKNNKWLYLDRYLNEWIKSLYFCSLNGPMDNDPIFLQTVNRYYNYYYKPDK